MAEYRLYNGKEVTKEEIEKAVCEERALIVYEDGNKGKLVFYKDYNEALAVKKGTGQDWDSGVWAKWPSVEGALLIAGRSTVKITILLNGQEVEVEDGDMRAQGKQIYKNVSVVGARKPLYIAWEHEGGRSNGYINR